MREYLITEQDFDKWKPLAKYCDSLNKLNPHIIAAQLFDVSPMLSDDDTMLNDLLANPENVDPSGKNGDLLKLIQPMLVQYAYARYLPEHDIVPTASGLKKKKNEFSEALTSEDVAMLINKAQAGALEYAIKVEKYLKKNAASFPLYKPLRCAHINVVAIMDVDVNDKCEKLNWKNSY